MPSPDLFTREEALGGLPARRARTLLFLIESRSARLAEQARQAMVPYRSEQAIEQDDLAFFKAFTEGRDPPRKPTIQDIEHFAGQWAPLVPDEPRILAAVAHTLAEKYQFTYAAVPGIRSTLRFDGNPVQQAYQRQFGSSIKTIYQTSPSLNERLRWAWTRLDKWVDSLPPFWTSFALTLTETVGCGVLALPIALAGIGPLPGIILIILMGLVNVLTITCAAESAARSGTVRYGSGFMGRMVGDYLGSMGSTVLTAGVAIFSAIQLFATYIGFGSAMAPLTNLPPTVWMVGLFLVVLYFLRRESLNATIASALLVGVISIAALLLLLLLAFARLEPANLVYFHVPFINGEPFQPALLELIFGVVLASFFGHMSVNNCARIVLRRDASARSLIGGAIVAQIVSIVLYSIWTLAVSGSVPPSILANETGTVLGPLTERIGPIAIVVSTVYAVLTLAMGSIYNALSLYNLVGERLPRQTRLTLTLPCRHGRLVFTPRKSLQSLFQPQQRKTLFGISYLGLEGSSRTATCPRLRLDLVLEDGVHVVEITPGKNDGAWNESALSGRFLKLHESGIQISFHVLETTAEQVSISFTTPMAVRYEGQWESARLDLITLLDWTDTERRVWKYLSRQPEASRIEDIVTGVGVEKIAVQEVLKALTEKELASEIVSGENIRYRARFAARRGHTLPGLLVENMVPILQDAQKKPDTVNLRAQPGFWAGLDRPSRYWFCALPTVLVFFVSEWLLLNGQASFSVAFSLSGVLLGSLLAGFFPVLLLFASRRKGDVVPGLSPRLVGNPVILVSVYLLYLAGVMVYGLIIWQQPVERGAAIGIGLLAIAMPVIMLRRHAFRSAGLHNHPQPHLPARI